MNKNERFVITINRMNNSIKKGASQGFRLQRALFRRIYTSSMTAISAASPLRGPTRVMRV